MQPTHRILLAAVAMATLGLAACPGPKAPLGPPPEYEDPPAPQAPAAPSAAPSAPAPPLPPDAGPLGDG